MTESLRLCFSIAPNSRILVMRLFFIPWIPLKAKITMISTSKFRLILRDCYQIVANDIIPMEPGWTALAYKVYTEDGKIFFLKVYDKSRNSIAHILDAVPVYLFFIDWINSSASLKGKITSLINTKNGDVKVEDENYIYIVMAYIEGHTVGENLLTHKQVHELADIVSNLHGMSPPVSIHTESITEKFTLPWLSELKAWMAIRFNTLKPEIKNILIPYLDSLYEQVKTLENQAEQLRKQDLSFVLCHTDIHNWNIIADEKQIYLIDWEGIKYAPAEADLFGLYNEPYFSAFLEYYKKHHPAYEINRELLRYYMVSRHMTDIWEGIEQLQFDNLSSGDFQRQLKALQEVCEENAEFIRMFMEK